MRNHLLAALGSKVVIGAAATVLAFSTAGAVLVLQPASDSTPSGSGGPFVAADETTTTTSTTSTTSTTVAPTTTTTSTTVADHDADDDHGKAGTEAKHDNFGAVVSKDAHDGGVDGQEISAAAHKRNDARKAQHDANHEDNSGSGRDHAEDGD
jgi:hypothetical protein